MTRPTTSDQERDLVQHPSHEHAWRTQSVHRTSEGEVVYVRCVGCGIHRVDLRTHAHLPPVAISAPIGSGR